MTQTTKVWSHVAVPQKRTHSVCNFFKLGSTRTMSPANPNTQLKAQGATTPRTALRATTRKPIAQRAQLRLKATVMLVLQLRMLITTVMQWEDNPIICRLWIENWPNNSWWVMRVPMVVEETCLCSINRCPVGSLTAIAVHLEVATKTQTTMPVTTRATTLLEATVRVEIDERPKLRFGSKIATVCP